MTAAMLLLPSCITIVDSPPTCERCFHPCDEDGDSACARCRSEHCPSMDAEAQWDDELPVDDMTEEMSDD
jgi:hypothetical protein